MSSLTILTTIIHPRIRENENKIGNVTCLSQLLGYNSSIWNVSLDAFAAFTTANDNNSHDDGDDDQHNQNDYQNHPPSNKALSYGLSQGVFHAHSTSDFVTSVHRVFAVRIGTNIPLFHWASIGIGAVERILGCIGVNPGGLS